MATTMMTQMCSAAARRMMMTKPISPTYSAVVASAPVVCGRGDKKTKKGKRFKGSYGNSRPKKDKKIERIKDRVEVSRSTPWPLSFKLV
uniref:30S ribosomal protein S31, mitochondrial n=1 Tax=Kalanchoe fedtschenkoi TaxID=63787 RepID=A0A7N0TVS3_KALFE